VWSWFTFWLLLHVLTAIAGFGPNFAFPVIGAHIQKHPESALSMSQLAHNIQSRVIIPAAVVMPFLGVALIFSAHIQLWQSEWLIISIVLYIILFFFAVLVQRKNSVAMIDALTRAASSSEPRTGPPPGVPALAKRLQMGGAFLTLLLVSIIVLMVWRPGNCISVC
jgi:predicted integral membrane protein DUF2269